MSVAPSLVQSVRGRGGPKLQHAAGSSPVGEAGVVAGGWGAAAKRPRLEGASAGSDPTAYSAPPLVGNSGQPPHAVTSVTARMQATGSVSSLAGGSDGRPVSGLDAGDRVGAVHHPTPQTGHAYRHLPTPHSVASGEGTTPASAPVAATTQSALAGAAGGAGAGTAARAGQLPSGPVSVVGAGSPSTAPSRTVSDGPSGAAVAAPTTTAPYSAVRPRPGSTQAIIGAAQLLAASASLQTATSAASTAVPPLLNPGLGMVPSAGMPSSFFGMPGVPGIPLAGFPGVLDGLASFGAGAGAGGPAAGFAASAPLTASTPTQTPVVPGMSPGAPLAASAGFGPLPAGFSGAFPGAPPLSPALLAYAAGFPAAAASPYHLEALRIQELQMRQQLRVNMLVEQQRRALGERGIPLPQSFGLSSALPMPPLGGLPGMGMGMGTSSGVGAGAGAFFAGFPAPMPGFASSMPPVSRSAPPPVTLSLQPGYAVSGPSLKRKRSQKSTPTAAKAKAKGRKKSPPPTKRRSGHWSAEEDQRLRDGVAARGAKNWRIISQEYLKGERSEAQCLHRWNKVLRPGLVKGPWSPEEDAIILQCVQAGMTSWVQIAQRVPGRIGKQCRERWYNHLCPGLNKSPWTPEEDALLEQLMVTFGRKWQSIAFHLPGRTANNIKNRYNCKIAKQATARAKALEATGRKKSGRI